MVAISIEVSNTKDLDQNGLKTDEPKAKEQENVLKNEGSKQEINNTNEDNAIVIVCIFFICSFFLAVTVVPYSLYQDMKIQESKRQEVIKETRESLQNMECVGEVPDRLMNKWIPKVSEFKGVDEYLQKEGANETWLEDFMYFATPKFVKGDGIEFQMVKGSGRSSKIHFKANCVYHDIKVNKSRKNDTNAAQTFISIVDGELHIHEQGKSGNHDFNYTRVYYIPDNNLFYNFKK